MSAARPATRQNLFGFGRKPAPVVKPRKGRGGLTLAEAGSAAFQGGEEITRPFRLRFMVGTQAPGRTQRWLRIPRT
jgi:hypothetical protein